MEYSSYDEHSFGLDSGFGSLPLDYPMTQDLSDIEEAARYFDAEGGDLFLVCNVHLHIPPGALAERQQIQVSVMDLAEVGCPQSENTPKIMPLVRCSPDGTRFLKPVQLVIPHCAKSIKDPDSVPVEVYTRSHSVQKGAYSGWVRDDEASSSAILQQTTCSIELTHFSDFDIFVKDGNRITDKLLRAFPVIEKMDGPDDDLIVTLWMCNDLDSTYNNLLQEQTSNHRKMLLDSYVSYVLKGSDKPVPVEYMNLSKQYNFKNSDEKIGYRQLWFGSRGAATIRLTRNNDNWTGKEKLNGDLMAQQEGNESISFCFQKKVTEFFMMSQEARDEPCPTPPIQGAAQSLRHPPILQLDHDLKQKLSDCLDLDNCLGSNWKYLAHELKYTAKEIRLFEKRSICHTYEVLTEACQSGKLGSLEQLLSISTKLKRVDAVRIIEEHVEQLDDVNGNIQVHESESGGDTQLIDSSVCSNQACPEPMDTTSSGGAAMGVNRLSDFSESESSFLNGSNEPLSSTPTRNSSSVSTPSSEQDDLEDSGIFSPDAYGNENKRTFQHLQAKTRQMTLLPNI